MISCMMSSRDTESRRRTQMAMEPVSGSSQNSAPQWAHDVIHRFHVMDDDKVDPYIAANIENFWKKYDNNGTGEIYESEGEVFMRALLGPNNRFRLAPGALSDMDSGSLHVQNEFSATPDLRPYKHRYELKDMNYPDGRTAL